MTKTIESPSPVLTLALSSKWRGDSVEGEEIAALPHSLCSGLRLTAMTMGVEGGEIVPYSS